MKNLHFAILLLLCLPFDAHTQQDSQQILRSPDGRYSVEIVQKPMRKADATLDFFTLVLSSKGKPVARVPSYGHLTAAFWSDDGNYVAVNNRRGNSGDYLWVFRLADGDALKRPMIKQAGCGKKSQPKLCKSSFPRQPKTILYDDG
jgi:hypothetical protein